MPQYQYAVIYHHHGTAWRVRGQSFGDQDDLLDLLTEAGQHGWEVVGAGNFVGSAAGHEIIISRRSPN